MVLVLMTVLMLAAYNGAVTATKSSNLDYRAARVSYAAEGGADAIWAQLADALEDGLLEDGELASVTLPEIEGFTFSAMTVEKIGGVEVETVTDGPFAGLYSLKHPETRDYLAGEWSLSFICRARRLVATGRPPYE